MSINKQIAKEKKSLARCEKSLALEKLKNRRADTRRKIQLGGLVIKAGMDGYNKSVILGALDQALHYLKQDSEHLHLLERKGDLLFLS